MTLLSVRKVEVGRGDERYGTIEATPDGFQYEGNEPELQAVIRRLTWPKEPQDMPGGLEGLLGYMVGPGVNNGYLWVAPLDPPRDVLRAQIAADLAARHGNKE